jgi:flagellar hook-length control protein FliK
MDCKVGDGSTRAERLPVPRVASETNVTASPHQALGPRRPAGAEAKQQSTSFATLLDDAGEAAPPSPHDRRERAQASSAADAANDARPHQRGRIRHENKHENRPEKADGADSADGQQPVSDAKPKENSDAKEANAAEGRGDEDKPTGLDAIDSTQLTTATDASAEQQPGVSGQAAALAVPVATPVLPDTVAANAETTDVAAAMDAAGARGAQVQGTNNGTNNGTNSGANSGTNAGLDIGSEKGANAGVDIGLGEAGEADTAEASAASTGQADRKAGSGVASGADTSDASKATHAKPSARAKSAAATGTETPSRDQPGDAEGSSQTGIDAAGKSEHAGAGSGRSALQNTAQKPDEASIRTHADAKAGDQADDQAGTAADIGKPPVDAAQLAAPHPTSRFPSLTPATAHAAAAGSSAVPVAGLAVEIAARAQAGGTRFEIRLDPPELGRIDVRLDVDQSGQVTTRLVVEKAETLDFLRRDAPELERALQQAGLKTGDNGLQFTLRDQGGQNQDSGENWRSNVAKLVVPDPEMNAVETVPGGYGRSLRLGSGIDIRV